MAFDMSKSEILHIHELQNWLRSRPYKIKNSIIKKKKKLKPLTFTKKEKINKLINWQNLE